MDSNDKKINIRVMLTLFGAAALSIMFFFIIFRFTGFSKAVSKLMRILMPMIYGASIAYLLKPICNFYERKLREMLPSMSSAAANLTAVAGSMVTALFIVYLLLMIIIPQVAASVTALINIIPGKLEQAYEWVNKIIEEDTVITNYFNYVYDTVSEEITPWLKDFSPHIKEILGGVGEQLWISVIFFKNMFIGIIVALYLLIARKKFARHSKLVLYSIVKTKWADAIIEEMKYADSMFVGFINGKLLDSAIIGVICYICSTLFKFPNAMLVSVIVGVTNIIPFFGPFIGAVPAALLILIESPIKMLWFILFVLVLQQVDGNIIGPKILGNSTGLSSFWVLFSILIFGGLWGFVGMIIGVPLFAVIYDVGQKLIIFGLKKHNCEEMLNKET